MQAQTWPAQMVRINLTGDDMPSEATVHHIQRFDATGRCGVLIPTTDDGHSSGDAANAYEKTERPDRKHVAHERHRTTETSDGD